MRWNLDDPRKQDSAIEDAQSFTQSKETDTRSLRKWELWFRAVNSSTTLALCPLSDFPENLKPSLEFFYEIITNSEGHKLDPAAENQAVHKGERTRTHTVSESSWVFSGF